MSHIVTGSRNGRPSLVSASWVQLLCVGSQLLSMARANILVRRIKGKKSIFELLVPGLFLYDFVTPCTWEEEHHLSGCPAPHGGQETERSGQGTMYTFQQHAPSGLLPLNRSQLLKLPYIPKRAPVATLNHIENFLAKS